MLEKLPYADLLAIHNALTEKPARRFDTRANGEKRTAALMEQQGLTLDGAARIAEVVLPEPGDVHGGIPGDCATEPDESTRSHEGEDETTLAATPGAEDVVTVTIDADIASPVKSFIEAMSKADRPAWLTSFLRRLNGEGPRSPTVAQRGRQMSASQSKIVELCRRPEGATGKELADGCGWPSIAARATCQKIVDRYGYVLRETPRTKERGISFHLTPKTAVEVEV